MARPRRILQPSKLNLIMEKNHKDLARRLAAERGISVSRLFVSWLMRDLDGQSAQPPAPENSDAGV